MLELKQLSYCIFFVFLSVWVSACTGGEEQKSTVVDNGSQSTPAVNLKETKLAATSEEGNVRVFSSISPLQAFQMLKARNDILFLDVRTMREREQAFIPGSHYISISAIFRETVVLPEDKAVLLVCSVGGRSYAAGKVLSARGHREVYNLSGGVRAWYKVGLPISTGTGK